MASEDNTRIFEAPILGSITACLIESETEPVVTIACKVNGKTITAELHFVSGGDTSARAVLDDLTPKLVACAMLDFLSQAVVRLSDDDDDDDDEYEEAPRTH